MESKQQREITTPFAPLSSTSLPSPTSTSLTPSRTFEDSTLVQSYIESELQSTRLQEASLSKTPARVSRTSDSKSSDQAPSSDRFVHSSTAFYQIVPPSRITHLVHPFVNALKASKPSTTGDLDTWSTSKASKVNGASSTHDLSRDSSTGFTEDTPARSTREQEQIGYSTATSSKAIGTVTAGDLFTLSTSNLRKKVSLEFQSSILRVLTIARTLLEAFQGVLQRQQLREQIAR